MIKKMIIKNKWKLMIASAVILLPILVGLILWNGLPEQFATHWGADGAADGFSSKAVAIFLPPVLMLAIHWLCVLVTCADPGNKRQNEKVFGMVLWILPVLSVVMNGLVYVNALGLDVSVSMVTLVCMGAAFVFIGNYLPKCRHNHTIGIKILWALENEENWNKTHRVAGKVWVAGGLLIIAAAFLPEKLFMITLLAALILLVGIPVLYSYLYHRKQVREGTATAGKEQPQSKVNTVLTKVSLIFVVIISVAAGVLLVTGDITMQYDADSFTIQATYWADKEVAYAEIDKVEYRDTDEPGSRTGGFGSPRLLLGTFENEEFGTYTRYSYTRGEGCVVLEVDGRILVIGGEDGESTKGIYEELLKRTADEWSEE